MKKYRLMAPGPTPVPEKVLLKMADTLIHHRTPQFQSVLKDVNIKLKKVFRTVNPVLIFASSGTGAMEASIVNVLSKGDKAMVIRGGKFGERFSEICGAYGIETVNYDVEWGDPADPDVLEKMLIDNPGIKAVYGTLCETSTGVVNDIEALGRVISKTDAIFVVDAISGLTAEKFCPDEWGVDMVIGGSQKGLMLPPGLGFLSVSDKARELIKTSDLPKFYFDMKAALKSYGKDDTPWTPAVSLINGLNAVLDILIEEGLDNVLARHARLAEVTREAMKALGLDLYSSRPANTLTAVKVPEGIDGGQIPKKLRDEQGITIAGGQGAVKGKIFRVAHLGYMDDFDTISVVSALEMVLSQLGYKVELGKGVAKAEELLSR